MKTIAQVSKESLILEAWLKKQKPGTQLAFDKIAKETGVPMTMRGRGFLRTALRRAGLEYSAIFGVGIELGSPVNGMAIIGSKLKRITRAVRRGSKTTDTIQQQFWAEMSPDDQKRVLFTGAIFGAIKIASEPSKLVFSKPLPQIGGAVSIPVPVVG